ncbi:MAG: hypothetical protein ACREPM_04150 [Gemmatimonadaceae bacterium]
MSEDRKPSDDSRNESDETTRPAAADNITTPDPADEVPVPGAMSAAEIDERAQVVEKLRRDQDQRSGDPPLDP